MARGSWTQSNFLSGEFSPSASGRIDIPQYKDALAECLNMYPQETGNVIRRPATMFIQPTYGGFDGALYPYLYSQTASYCLEFTADAGSNVWMRSYTGGHLVAENAYFTITAINNASPVQIALNTASAWNTGDQIMITVQFASLPASQKTMWSPLANRQFNVTKIDSTHFTLTDAVDGLPVDGSGFTGSVPVLFTARIPKVSVPYTGLSAIIQSMQVVGAESNLILVNQLMNSQPPLVVTATVAPTPTTDAVLGINTLNFSNGPYLGADSVDGPFTISGASGSVTFTTTGVAEINNGVGFVASDVGRRIQIVQSPPVWLTGTTYSTGNVVAYPAGVNAQAYSALPASVTNVGFEPDNNPAYWAPSPNGITYNWGIISAVGSSTSVTVNLQTTLPGNSTNSPIIEINLGIFGAVQGSGFVWPQAATFFEGRLIFGQGQTVIGSVIGGYNTDIVDMSPTDAYGNVLDTSGFVEPLIGEGTNTINWFVPDGASIIVGTGASEWQIQASQLGDPLTPTSFQAHQVTKLGSQFLNPVKPGIAIIFVDRYNKRVIEYLADPFTSKYSGKPINTWSQHLSPVYQLVYQDTPTPVVWTFNPTNTNAFYSCTYRRVSYFASEVPTIYGWAEHNLAGGRVLDKWLVNAYSSDGMQDLLYMMIYNGNNWEVQYLGQPFDDDEQLQFNQSVDGGMTGPNYSGPPYRFEGIYGVSDGNGNIYFNGLYYHRGETLGVFYAGIDMGDYVVDANGVVGPVPYTTFTDLAYLAATASPPNTYGAIPVSFNEAGGGNSWNGGVIGFVFTSTIKRLRPDTPADARTQQGTGAGDLRRHHWYSLNLSAAVTNTISVSGGNSFDQFYPATFYQGGAPVASTTLFRGVHRDTIDSEDDLDGQIIATVTRPVPFSLSSWSGFIETEEM